MEKVPHKLSEEPLTASDRKQLSKHMLAPIVIGIFFGAIFYIPFASGDFGESGAYLIIGFAILFIGVLAYIFISIRRDLDSGMKQVITGTITRKETKHTSSRNGRGKFYYYIYFDELKLTVFQWIYKDLRERELVEIKRGRRSNTILSYKVLESDLKKRIGHEFHLDQVKKPLWTKIFLVFWFILFAVIYYHVYKSFLG